MAAAPSSPFTVVTYDHRERGDSDDTLPYAVQREAEDITALITQVGAPAAAGGIPSARKEGQLDSMWTCHER